MTTSAGNYIPWDLFRDTAVGSASTAYSGNAAVPSTAHDTGLRLIQAWITCDTDFTSPVIASGVTWQITGSNAAGTAYIYASGVIGASSTGSLTAGVPVAITLGTRASTYILGEDTDYAYLKLTNAAAAAAGPAGLHISTLWESIRTGG